MSVTLKDVVPTVVLVKYPFKVNDRVKWPGGGGGVVIDLRGPYSSTVKDDRDGKPLIVSNSQLRKEGDGDPVPVSEM